MRTTHKAILALVWLIWQCNVLPVAAQTGVIEGTVLSANPIDSVAGAHVRLDYLDRFGYHRETDTDSEAHFVLTELLPGLYSISASLAGLGFATDLVEVTPNATTVTNLFLDGGSGEGEYGSTVTLLGTTIVVAGGSPMPQYYLDIGADSLPDYLLVFGPPWYEPQDGGAERPANGDLIIVDCTPFGYSSPQPVIVRQINQLPWRDQRGGHGGAIGQLHESLGCDEQAMVRMEGTGLVEIANDGVPPEEPTGYIFHWNADSLLIRLDFGSTVFSSPGQGARPQGNETVHIVGGLLSCGGPSAYRVIVYEIGGELWRIPGDTSGFSAVPVTSSTPRNPAIPWSSDILSNYPNPFNASTTFVWRMDRPAYCTLDVVDILGQRVGIAAEGYWNRGIHAVSWNCETCASGIYLLRLRTPEQTTARRITLMR